MGAVLAQADAESSLKAVPFSTRNGILEMMRMRRDPFAFSAERERKYGRVSGMNALGITIVTCSGPDAANQILMNKDRAFANGPAWTYLIGPFFNRGIMLLDFDEHRDHRHILQQAFTPKVLKGYMDELQPMVADRISRFPTGQVKMLSELKQLTLDVALEVFLGLELPQDEADRLNKAFIETVRAGVAYVRKPIPGGRWWKGIRSRKILEEFFYAHIDEKRATLTPDLFSVLCHAESEDGTSFTDEDVVNHMIFVLMAAHDTTTITMTQMSYWMAKHPEWQEKARAQSFEFGDNLEYADLANLTVIDLIMRESLRLCPPVPAQPRMAMKDTEVNGYFIPEGTFVVVPQLANHRSAEIYSHPDMFDPERFAPDRAEDKAHRMAWIPFGGGVHKCIGLYFAQMQIKTVMHQLLRHYEWSVPEGYTMPMDYSALPVPKDKLPVQMRRL
ncbi:cytochrome P450 [Gordonia sp. (in: high G+C Gram-positive bacteria)]|uniref:cytochrome P450 n=1 Tax=Gordonia sp. (in: high G+C Gram-positive bacteria) TaxID=84139 RepID=UPI003C759AC1